MLRSKKQCCLFFSPAALPSAILTLIFRPYQRGIDCNDQSIRYPYRRDTISHGTMAAVTITCSIVIVSPGVSSFWTHRYSEIKTSVLCIHRKSEKNITCQIINCCIFSLPATDHNRRGLPGAHQSSPLQLPVQPIPGSSLQSGGHLPVRSSCQSVADRLGKVHYRTSPSKLHRRVQASHL